MICPVQTNETDLLLDYSAGRLDAPRTVRLERHMEHCPACATFRMEQTALWHALDLWEPAPVSLDFNRRLWQRIDATPWHASLLETLRFANWKPVFPLTAALLVIAAGFLFDHPGARISARGVSVKEASQVEQTLDDIQLLHQLDSVALPSRPGTKSGDSKIDPREL